MINEKKKYIRDGQREIRDLETKRDDVKRDLEEREREKSLELDTIIELDDEEKRELR